LRTLALSVASLGLLILCLAMFVWVYRGRAKPYVSQAANLMCQHVKAFGCQEQLAAGTPSPTPVPLPPIAMAPQPRAPISQEPEEIDSLPMASRRLGAADAVVGYQNLLGADKQQAGNPKFCKKLWKLCLAPPAFDAQRACVCNGMWQRSNSVVPGPWNGSKGAFCKDWGSDGKGQWCFVSRQQQCHKDKQVIAGTDPMLQVPLVKSGGPCTDEVDSRSQLVLDGHDAMLSTIQGVIVMGLLLILLAACSGLVYRLSSSKGGGWQLHDYYGRGESEQLRQRFLEAQQYAMEVQTEETPEEIRTALYAYYNQAQKGDVQGGRPGFFSFAERSRYDAWERLRGMPQREAMEGYINAVSRLERA